MDNALSDETKRNILTLYHSVCSPMKGTVATSASTRRAARAKAVVGTKSIIIRTTSPGVTTRADREELQGLSPRTWTTSRVSGTTGSLAIYGRK